MVKNFNTVFRSADIDLLANKFIRNRILAISDFYEIISCMVAVDQTAVSYGEAGNGMRKSISSSRNADNRLPFFFWKGFALNSSSFGARI